MNNRIYLVKMLEIDPLEDKDTCETLSPLYLAWRVIKIRDNESEMSLQSYSMH